MTEASNSSTITGWREWIGLPEIGVPWIKAKIDSGAQTSALHAFDISRMQRGGEEWVRFGIHPWQATDDDAVFVELPVHDHRAVRSSNGSVEDRIVVLLDVVIAGRMIDAEVTLTDRSAMGFRMLIGREALRKGFLVDASSSFCGGRAPKKVRRRNRGSA